jgi:hypothetical protein
MKTCTHIETTSIWSDRENPESALVLVDAIFVQSDRLSASHNGSSRVIRYRNQI